MVSAALGTAIAVAAAGAAVTVGVTELLKEDLPGAIAPPGVDDTAAREAAQRERERRARARTRASTLLTPRGTLGQPLPGLEQKSLLGQ